MLRYLIEEEIVADLCNCMYYKYAEA